MPWGTGCSGRVWPLVGGSEYAAADLLLSRKPEKERKKAR